LPSTSLRLATDATSDPESLLGRFKTVRAESARRAAPLSAEDMGAQSMPDASPAKWHLAHTTWFFETFVLSQQPGYAPFDPRFGYLFNSYYEALGPRQPRPHRGLITRPSAGEVMAYRRHVDEAMEALLAGDALCEDLQRLVILGCAHEQQHQELLLTDILHLFGQSPVHPAYDRTLARRSAIPAQATPLAFTAFDGGVTAVGRGEAEGIDDFAFDNETPRHEVILRPYRLADRLVTNGEWQAFMADGGYRRPELWLSDGWACVQEQAWTAPLYWRQGEGDAWFSLTLAGLEPVEPAAPVTHVSFYEADAYARWSGCRLPTEAEWENAAAGLTVDGNFSAHGALRPLPASQAPGLQQMFGDCWEWTASPYLPYPGFAPAPGAVGEYNGKFMINQMVLRGGSCVTPEGHVSATYRNFFHPHQRWQFSGVRLAADAPAQPVPAKSAAIPAAGGSSFRRDVLEGLGSTPKAVPSKYFYDEAGSALFEAICEVEEYYPTRVETALLRDIAPALSAAIPAGAALVEFGSGASVKTRLLLDAAPQLSAYAPIDISPDALEPAAASIERAYPKLTVTPVAADFTRPTALPAAIARAPKVGFFPGSTIGNFSSEGARSFLVSARAMLGPGARFIIGVDLVKEEEVLVAAYDDAEGVTRAFNLNLLTRINRELDGDFDLDAFTHRAVWNRQESRMEAHLVSQKAQTVTVAGRAFRFALGESIHTENSYKYEPEAFQALAEEAGWTVEARWISPPPRFAVFLLKAPDAP
jgi:dimethylhistidine N-methyltransferase